MGKEVTAAGGSKVKKSPMPPQKTPVPPTAGSGLDQLLRRRSATDLPDCGKTISHRPADWRWGLAGFLEEDPRIGPLCAEEMDEPVAHAADFLRELRSLPSLEAIEGHHAEVEAIRLRISPSPRPRWEIEARILARQTPVEIAARCKITPEAVQVYEDWFYDVRDRPRGYADTYFFPLDGPMAEVPIEYTWKMVGYTSGPDILDDLLRGADGRIDAENADPEAWLRGDTEDRATMRRWIFLRVLPHLPKTTKIDCHLTVYYLSKLVEERSASSANVSLPPFPAPAIRAGDEAIMVSAPGASERV